ncbi:MAG TPA: gamma-glutamylcyclotransferase [Verrucomicrobiales bacterium]|nr:gamma-glutamylcyclotransferase [Verrucomicrobiales bacterium]
MDGAGIIYFAYGSNMSPAQMESRCPGGQAFGQAALRDWHFVINTRTYATIKAQPGATTYGVLWSLTQEHIDSLDTYEAVDEGMYYKDTLTVLHQDQQVEALVYIDPVCEHGQPRPEYLRGILHGARHFELPPDYVEMIAQDWGGA